MSTKQIIGNLGAVKGELSAMLDSLSAVKSREYADCVHQLLQVMQVQELSGLLVRMASTANVPQEVLAAISEGLSMTLSTMLTDYVTAKGVDEGRVQEIIADSERIKASINGLFKTAIQAGHNGISMEG
jgi:hypothetical protein